LASVHRLIFNEAQQEQALSLPEDGSRAGCRKIVVYQKLYDRQNPPPPPQKKKIMSPTSMFNDQYVIYISPSSQQQLFASTEVAFWSF
jgi:hypothetical protein